MERFEALRLIQDNLDDIVKYLEGLRAKLEPVFKDAKIRVFDVGVDIVETAVKNSLQYGVKVYDNSDTTRSASDIETLVVKAEPEYKGWSGILSGAIPYPVSSFIGLDLLKDMKSARE